MSFYDYTVREFSHDLRDTQPYWEPFLYGAGLGGVYTIFTGTQSTYNALLYGTPPDYRKIVSGIAGLGATYAFNQYSHNPLSHGRYWAGRLAMGVLKKATPAVILSTTPLMLFQANKQIIESAPEEEQEGLWEMFSSALSGSSWNVSGAAII